MFKPSKPDEFWIHFYIIVNSFEFILEPNFPQYIIYEILSLYNFETYEFQRFRGLKLKTNFGLEIDWQCPFGP